MEWYVWVIIALSVVIVLLVGFVLYLFHAMSDACGAVAGAVVEMIFGKSGSPPRR